MTYSKHQYGDCFVLNVTDQAIVFHTIPPQSSLVAVERLAPLARIAGRLQAVTQKT